MNNIVVIGAGTMGNGIAHTAAASGMNVTLIDVEQPILDRAMNTISSNLQRGVDKGRMSAGEKQGVLDRVRTTTDMKAVSGADIVIEAIIENLGAKTSLFEKLDRSAIDLGKALLIGRIVAEKHRYAAAEGRLLHEGGDGAALAMVPGLKLDDHFSGDQTQRIAAFVQQPLGSFANRCTGFPRACFARAS